MPYKDSRNPNNLLYKSVYDREYKKINGDKWNEYQRKKAAEWRQRNPDRYIKLKADPIKYEKAITQKRKYQTDNKEKLNNKNKENAKQLATSYILRQLQKESGISRKILKRQPILICAKRETLLIKRKIKNNDN